MISEKFNTVFVHIPKTAGQSIIRAFLAAHGLTWETRAALLLGPNSDPARGPNFLSHLYVREYVECGHLSPDRFASMFKFAVVRHPYDRFISEFRYRRSHEPYASQQISMEALWELRDSDPVTDIARHLARQTEFVMDANGNILVDRILRFETLADELPSVLAKIFGYAPNWAEANRSRGQALNRDMLGAVLKREIQKFYEVDFDTFEYSR